MLAPVPVYPDAPFPVERLVVSRGRLSASAHKNPYNPLHLDWSFGFGFAPLELGGTTYETGLSVELETLDVRRVEQFAGMERHDTERDFNIGSFYLFDYRGSRDTRFRVHSVRGIKLDVEAQVLVDVGDSYIDPQPPLRTVRIRAEAMFEGILVSSYGVQAEADAARLMSIARELFDIDAFAPPTERSSTYQGKPVLDLFFVPLT
jgi:hypothetical protein